MDGTAFRDAVPGLMTPPRAVTAIARFRGGPGREDEAAQAWAFELTYYFLRGVGEPPLVTYDGEIYTCTGLIQTTHQGDKPVTDFTGDAPLWLDSALVTARQAYLRALYPQRWCWFDGRDHG
jgi:hypothetical protein